MFRSISYRFRFRRYRRRKHGYGKFVWTNARFITLLIGVVFTIIIIMLFPHFIRNTYKVTITNKQIVQKNNTKEYLIYAQTDSGELKVFVVTNNLLELQFNSEDLYWAVAINRKYEIRAYGFNIPMLSDYQNIVKIKGITG